MATIEQTMNTTRLQHDYNRIYYDYNMITTWIPTQIVVLLKLLLYPPDGPLLRKLRDHVGVLLPEAGVRALFGHLGCGALSPGWVRVGELGVQTGTGRCQVAPGRFLGLSPAHGALFPGIHISLYVHVTVTFLQSGVVPPDFGWTHGLDADGSLWLFTAHVF